jgi:hypothetical protein
VRFTTLAALFEALGASPETCCAGSPSTPRTRPRMEDTDDRSHRNVVQPRMSVINRKLPGDEKGSTVGGMAPLVLTGTPRAASSESSWAEPHHEGYELDGESDHPRSHADIVPGRVPVSGQDRPNDDRHPGREGQRLHPERCVAGARCLRGPREPFPYFSPDGRSRRVPPPTQPRQAPRAPPRPARSGASTVSSHWGARPQRTPHPPAVPARLQPALHQRC